MVILDAVREHSMTKVVVSILKLCADIDTTLPLKKISDENEVSQPKISKMYVS